MESTAATANVFLLIMLLISLTYSNCAFLWLRVLIILPRICTSVSHGVHSSHATTSYGTCIISLYTLRLEICDYISSYTLEYLLNIKATLSTSFKKLKTMLISQCLPSNCVHHFGIFRHICFICNQYFLNVRNCMLIYLL